MPDLERQITLWRSQMLDAGIQSPVPLDELEAHLRDEIAGLIQSGVSEEKAFRLAVSAVGDGSALRREFSRARRFRFIHFRDNPPAFNFLGACFFLLGLSSALCSVRVMFMDPGPFLTPARMWIIAGLYLFFGLQLFVGLGIMWRSNFWRYGALVAVVMNLLSNGYGLFTMLRDVAAYSRAGLYYPIMGVYIPICFQWLTSLAVIVLMFWAFRFLMSASGRKLFRRAVPGVKTFSMDN